jgi:hypothetical protein
MNTKCRMKKERKNAHESVRTPCLGWYERKIQRTLQEKTSSMWQKQWEFHKNNAFNAKKKEQQSFIIETRFDATTNIYRPST